MPEGFKAKVDRILRDHEGYTGDGRGGVGDLPIGDRSTAKKPISKRDLRESIKAFGDIDGNATEALLARDQAVSAAATAAADAAAAADAQIAPHVAAAEAAAAGAQAAQGLAEAARDAATVNAGVYADTAAGLAATTEGDQFQVVSDDEIIRYRHDAGPVATEVARYPTAEKVAAATTPRPDYLVRANSAAVIDPSWLPTFEAIVPATDPAPYGWWKTGEKIEAPLGGKDVITNWSPSALAAAGFEGNWLSALDTGYLFQDYEGLVPVTAEGHPVRLAVCRLTGDPGADRTYAGLVNGQFATDLSGWTVPAGQASVWDNGRAHVHAGGGATGISQVLDGLVPGRTYRVSAEVEVDAASTETGRRAELLMPGATILDSNTITGAGATGVVHLWFVATATSHTLFLRASSSPTAGPAVWYDNLQISAFFVGDYIADHGLPPPIYAQHADGGPCIRWRSADGHGGLRPAIGLSMLGKPANFVLATLGSRESDVNFAYYLAVTSNRVGLRNGANSGGTVSDGLFGYSTPPGSGIVGAGAATERSGMEGVVLTSYWGGSEPQRLYRNRTLLAQTSAPPPASNAALTIPWVPYIGNRAEKDRASDLSIRDWIFGRVDRALTAAELRRLNQFAAREAAPPLTPDVARVASIGASSTAGHSGNPVTINLVQTSHARVSLDVGGSTIASRKAAWTAYAHKSSIRWVNIQIGLNDMQPSVTLPTLIARLQDLVDNVRPYLLPGAVIMLSQVTPARGRFHDLFGEIDGDLVYNSLWLPYNEAIMGLGPTPITGVDIRVDAHQIALNDGSGYLIPERDRGDHIHFDPAGVQINVDAWEAALIAYGIANGYPTGWW